MEIVLKDLKNQEINFDKSVKEQLARSPFPCAECGKRYKTLKQIQEHARIHVSLNAGEQPFKCGQCDKGFTEKLRLNKHVLRVHLRPIRFTCEECGKGFTEKRLLRSHVTHNHSDDRPYKCLHCDKTFKKVGIKKRHELTHTGEKVHQCGICSKSFRDNYDLKEHMKYHSLDEKFTCHLCSKEFTLRRVWRAHSVLCQTKSLVNLVSKGMDEEEALETVKSLENNKCEVKKKGEIRDDDGSVLKSCVVSVKRLMVVEHGLKKGFTTYRYRNDRYYGIR